ncbi:MAG: FecR domain-containing protein [Bacteroidales bacterium]|nr:FecR domain-containing protein [Bacteroidales bacterium]
MDRKDMLDFVLRHYRENALDAEKALKAVKKRARVPLLDWRMVAGVAAAMVLVAGLAFLGRSNSMTTLMAYDQTREIQLPDGSMVSLAPGSELTFNQKRLSGDGKRKVRLEGKAFFDVEHVETRPFEICTPGGFVRVLGTKFQVDDNKHEVYVLSGKVFFAKSEGDEGVVLTNGMSASLVDGAALPVVDEAATGNQIAWKRGTFIYDGQPLSLAIEELEEYYGKEIEVDDMGNDISDARIVGSFDVDSPKDVLSAISDAFDIRLRFIFSKN